MFHCATAPPSTARVMMMMMMMMMPMLLNSTYAYPTGVGVSRRAKRALTLLCTAASLSADVSGMGACSVVSCWLVCSMLAG